MKTHISSAQGLLVVLFLVGACSDGSGNEATTIADESDVSGGDDGDDGEGALELVSFWTNEADAQAMQVLIYSYKASVPGGEVTNIAEDWTTAFEIRADRLGKPASPDIVQGFPRYLP